MNIDEEITKLIPSAELLEHYRKKIIQYEQDYEGLNLLLNKYGKTANPAFTERERERLTNDLEELQHALSDVNVFIHAERQQVASLYFEKENLKVDLEIAEKKIAILLHLSNLSEDHLQAYLQSSKKKDVFKQALSTKQKIQNSKLKEFVPVEGISESERALQKKLKLLEDHYYSAKSAWQEEKNILLEDRILQRAEVKAQRDQDLAHINVLTAKLEEAQIGIYEATKKALKSNSEMHKSKSFWLAERDKLMQDLREGGGLLTMKNNLEAIQRSGSYTNLENLKDSCEVRQMKREVSSLKKDLRDCNEMKILFETRCSKIEQELSKLKAQKEAEQTLYKEKIKKLHEMKELHRKQRDKLELRRKTDAEGFLNELKGVKNELRKVVHQFFKLMNFYSQSKDLPDLSQVDDIKLATTLARSLHHAIANAKKKVIMEPTFEDD